VSTTGSACSNSTIREGDAFNNTAVAHFMGTLF